MVLAPKQTGAIGLYTHALVVLVEEFGGAYHIGEASNRIDDDFKLRNPKIEWRRIRGFRNRIVHDYFGIDYEIVWEIVENYIEELMYSLEEIIEEKSAT